MWKVLKSIEKVSASDINHKNVYKVLLLLKVFVLVINGESIL